MPFQKGNSLRKGKKPWNRGISPSKITRDKIRARHTGRHFTKEWREKLSSWQKGRIIPDRTRLKMSEARIGENNPAWKGGITIDPYPKNWNEILRKEIRKRDGYICFVCKVKENRRKLAIHHIDYNKTNCDPKNLISLCNSCHSKTNYNRENWRKFFSAVWI